MDGKKEIVKILNSMSGRYSGYEIFSDWIRCLALTIEQSTHLIRNKDWQDREQAYLDTIKRYTPEEQTQLAVMTARLIETLEDGPADVLGEIYMEAGLGSKIAGQFFTPFHLAELTAKAGLDDKIEKLKSGELGRLTVLDCNLPMLFRWSDAGTANFARMMIFAQDEGFLTNLCQMTDFVIRGKGRSNTCLSKQQ